MGTWVLLYWLYANHATYVDHELLRRKLVPNGALNTSSTQCMTCHAECRDVTRVELETTCTFLAGWSQSLEKLDGRDLR